MGEHIMSEYGMPYTIALTGGIASGKSTVARYFEQLGARIVDADVVARQLVEPNQPALTDLVAHFGVNILTDEGALNRPALRAHIFQHPKDKQWLETYLHPRIRHTMQYALAQTPAGHYAIAVIPLLQETGVPDYVNRVLVVDCKLETQLKRLIKRDDIDETLARAIIAQQAKREDRLAIADDIIDNSTTEDFEAELKRQCEALHQQYRISNVNNRNNRLLLTL